jgi:uncharacterized protein YggT (Ycf19 family)
LVKGGVLGEKAFATKTARKIVDYNNSNTKLGTTTDSGISSAVGSSSETGSEASTSSVGKTTEGLKKVKVNWVGAEGSNNIPSVLEEGLSPLELLLNCEILINIMILIHIIFSACIWIHQKNLKSSGGFFSQICNKFTKVQKIIHRIGEMTNSYLSSLLIINILIIVFYVFLNVYINIEVTSHLNEYTYVYNKYQIKKGGIFLLLLNSQIPNSLELVRDNPLYVNVNTLKQRLFSTSNKNLNIQRNIKSPSALDRNLNLALTEKKVLELITDHFEWKDVVTEKRKLIISKSSKEAINEFEKDHHLEGFASLFSNEELKSEYEKRDYNKKIKFLEIWWNEKRNRSLNKRSEYFKQDSVFYTQLSAILSFKDEKISDVSKQLRLEKWIIDYENYRIRSLIEQGAMDRSSESKIYSNIFISFSKEWQHQMSKYQINNYRALKKLYNVSIEKNNLNCNYKFLCYFIFSTMGPLNTFSILFNKILELVFKGGGIKFNELVMKVGEHLTSNFYIQLKKELNMESTQSEPKSPSNVETRKNWEIPPLEFYVELKSKPQIGINSDNSITDRDSLLALFTNISEEFKAEIGHSFMIMLKESCKEMFFREIKEENKSYIFVTFSMEFQDDVFVQSINTMFLPMICKPSLWSKGVTGGYISLLMKNYASPESQILKSNPKVIGSSKISQNQIDCINYMNSVPFKINTYVLHYLMIEWEKEDSTLFKGLNKLHPNTFLIKDKKTDRLLFKEIQSHNSKHHNYLNILMLANLYKDQVFYIPTFLDFRGRLYSKVSYLTYQGGDLARSLIQFYSPNEKIFDFKVPTNPLNTPINYVKQYAGNVYNLSKNTINSKIKWCDKFIKQMTEDFDKYYIVNYSNTFSTEELKVSAAKLSDPNISKNTIVDTETELEFDYSFLNKYLDTADEPFQFISVYFTLKDIFIKKQYNINIPILFDASCSGIQHLAGITCDLNVAKMVNVVSSTEHKSDFYQIAAEYVAKSINNLDLNNEIKEKLKLIKVTRSILKLPVMTITYNIGLEKMSKELLTKMGGKLVEKDDLIVTENREDTNRTLPMDLPELEAEPLSFLGETAETEHRSEYSSGKKTFQIQINKEHSKIDKDLFLSPKEWSIFAVIIFKCVFELAPAIKEFNQYLKNFMFYLGKRNLTFNWETPSGLKIKFGLGEETTLRAGLKFIRKGSGVSIKIVNKDKIKVQKSVVALMPNFIHSLDASNIHELTNFLHKLNIAEIQKELERETKYTSEMDLTTERIDYLIKNYTIDWNNSTDRIVKDNTFSDLSVIWEGDLITVGALKKIVPLYTIHDCFATTPNNMALIKNNVTRLFSEMYFSTSYIKILHISLLKRLLEKEKVYCYPIEFIKDETRSNDKIEKLKIKNFKEVKVVLKKTKKIDLNNLENYIQDIFDSKYYLITEDYIKPKKWNLIPLFPPLINENIQNNIKTLGIKAPNSAYLIS